MSAYPPPGGGHGYDPYAAAAAYQQQQGQFQRQPSESSDGGYIYSSINVPAATGNYGDPYAGYAAAVGGVPVGHAGAGAVAGGGYVDQLDVGYAVDPVAQQQLAAEAMSGSESVSGGSGGSTGTGGEDSAVDFDDPRIADLPRILLMGPRRGGKTSIQRVVFHKMSPHETLFRLEATQNLERFVVDHTPLCRFTIWDFPGDYYGSMGGGVGGVAASPVRADAGFYGAAARQAIGPNGQPMDYLQPGGGGHPASGLQRQPPAHGADLGLMGGGAAETRQQPTAAADKNAASPGADGEQPPADDGDAYVFGRATALIFVIDAQDEPYDHVLQNFTETVTRAVRANPHVAIEVFINKVDGELFLSDEAKYDCRRDVMQQVSDELADAGVPPDSVPISYHLTSIYDHSVFEAFSRVVQKLIPQLPTLENLLNVLVSTCSMEKAYLFDVASKLYISTDSSPVDMQSVELCSDMIDVVLDVSGIYGLGGTKDAQGSGTAGGEVASLSTPAQEAGAGDVGSLTSDLVEKGLEVKVANADDGDMSNAVGEQQSYITSDSAAVAANADGGEANDELVGTLISQSGGADDGGEKEKEADADSAYDSESSSVIRLSNGMVLYLKEVDTMLALVCLTRSENFRKKSLINYNIACLKKALRALVQPNSEKADPRKW